MSNVIPALETLPLIESHHQQMSVLLKGPPGVGKTQLAHSFPGPVESFYVDPNRSTVLEFISRGGVTVRQLTEWSTFNSRVLPAIVNRQLQCSTIVIDGFDFLFTTLVTTSISRRNDARQAWGDVLETATQDIFQLTQATAATKDHPGYNIVVTSRTKKITDSDGNLTNVVCALQGQFLDRFEAFFDYVLICEKGVRTIPQQGKPAVKKTLYFVHTVPPTRQETAKAPSGWPATIEIEHGEDSYEKLQAAMGKPEPLVPTGDHSTNDNNKQEN